MPITFDKTPAGVNALRASGKTMRVRMKETRNAYEAGKSYDLPIDLAFMYIRNGRAYQDKSIDGPPEVKIGPNVTLEVIEAPAKKGKKKRS